MRRSNEFRWLHLTDFHYGLDDQDFLWPTLRGPFLDDLTLLHDQTGPWDAVFFTGDLVQSGKKDEFTQMEAQVLTRIFTHLRSLGSGHAPLYCVPGNHDLVRPESKPGNAAVDRLLEKDGFNLCKRVFWKDPQCDYRKVVNDAFVNYVNWWKSNPYSPHSFIHDGELPGDFSATQIVNKIHIGIIGINTTFLQLGRGNYEGRLEWHGSQIFKACPEDTDDWLKKHDICILLTHQGPVWLTKTAQEHGKTEVVPAGRFALHMYGHMHVPKLDKRMSGGSTLPVTELLGRSAFGLEYIGEDHSIARSHGYSVGSLAFEESGSVAFRLWPRVATNSPDRWRYIRDEVSFELLQDGGTAPTNVWNWNPFSKRLPKYVDPVQEIHSGSIEISEVEKVMFYIYRPEFDEWYLERSVDSHFRRTENSNPLWIFGPSGCGKTVAVQRFAHKSFSRFIFADLSSSAGLDLASMLEDLFWTLATQLNIAEPKDLIAGDRTPVGFLHGIERAITSTPLVDTLILIDEFSCSDHTAVVDFIKLTTNLLLKISNFSPSTSFQIVIGSMISPLQNQGINRDKVYERISILSMQKWTEEELTAWIELASKTLHWLKSTDIKAPLLRAANGCPRKLKLICRLHSRYLDQDNWSIEKTIYNHQDELRIHS